MLHAFSWNYVALNQLILIPIDNDNSHFCYFISVKYLRLDGSNEPETHFKIVQDFNSDPNINVLLLTTHVGGLGLNLTSADTLVFVEHDRNPMRDHQAMDKAHRLGQEKEVNVHRLIMRETLEEQVMSKERFEVSVTNAANNLRLLCSVDHSDGVTELVGSGGLVDLWDQSHYADESNVDQFLAKLNALHISLKRKTPNFDTSGPPIFLQRKSVSAMVHE
ncbi:TATA-binding protein-associated factor BTAF1-like isoform X2 [Lotus japonicus]|uniref:TATA-binding protein-associated factor BTAF1-like isoform X2 n=1 Tax=Lotus japonicus TaxID=34305 RepID=UPI0025856F65|nr:TATA-binding protein-associated factor BTAF1-like isoform X2 [Lotus japonicus]